MGHVLCVILLLVGVSQVAAQSLKSGSGAGSPSSAGSPAPAVAAPPPTSGRPAGTNSGSRGRSSVTTPYALSGKTVCSRGPVDERPVSERSFWFDGTTVGLPGYRCITLQ